MFNNPYNLSNGYNAQDNIERINNQIAQLENMRKQLQQPPVQNQPTNLTQNFQLAPNREAIRYANSIDEVEKDMVISDTPFFSRDMSVVWIKNSKGGIKTYELEEIIPKDTKDLQIELLQAQINELKGMITNDANVTNADAEQNAANTTGNDETIRNATEKKESTSVQKVSRSKKE